MTQFYISVIHQKIIWNLQRASLCANGTCQLLFPPAQLSVDVSGLIHLVPTTTGFLSEWGVHEQDNVVAHSNQASAFNIAFKLSRQRLTSISQFPSLIGTFQFSSIL